MPGSFRSLSSLEFENCQARGGVFVERDMELEAPRQMEHRCVVRQNMSDNTVHFFIHSELL